MLNGSTAVILVIIAAILTFLLGFLRGGCIYPEPRGQPPSWVFSLVWPLLFIFIGIAGYRIFDRTISIGRRIAFISLLLTIILWPILFWGFCSYALGTVMIAISIFLTLVLIAMMIPKDIASSLLLVPLLLWLCYAYLLSFRVARTDLVLQNSTE